MTQDSIVFDRAAGFYDETRGFPQGEEAHVAALMKEAGQIQSKSRVLEIGVGTGRISAPLTAHVNALYGIDLSMPMMSRIREKPGGGKVLPAQADAGRLPFADDSFDVVIVVHVFHLIPDILVPLREIARVLKPEGRMLHGWNNSHGGIFSELRRIFADTSETEGSRQGWERTMPVLLENGWTKLQHEYAYDYFQEEALQTFIDTFRTRKWSGTWKLSDEDLQRGIQAMQTVALERVSDLKAPVRNLNTFYVDVFTPPA